MNLPSVVIETARLRLRLLRDDDLADLVALIGNWEVARRVSSVPHPYSEADGREWIVIMQKDHATGRPRRFAVALKENDRIIGGVGLDGDTGTETDEPAFGYWLGQPYWGKGYGREAVAAVIDYGFRTLGIRTIRAYTDPSNTASQKVLLHCGLVNVGEVELTKPTVTVLAARRCSASRSQNFEKGHLTAINRYRPCLTRLTNRRGVGNFHEFSRFHVVDIAVYRNVMGNQRVVSDTHDILYDALGVVREC
jgi:RimJ/RimL family protein N-acetyltransferase